jgi:Domain of unknown function (DUF4279)
MENSELGRNKASLRIISGISSVEKITETLKMEADSFHVKGSKAIPNHPKSYVYPTNMWSLQSDLDELESLEQHISRLVEFVESRVIAFTELIKTCEIGIFCGYFPNGWTGNLSLSANLLKRLTIIPVKIIVKLYEPISEEE